MAVVASALDADGNPLSVAVSNLPGDVSVIPSIAGGSISLSVMANCTIVTTNTSRTYPITLTVTDSNGSTASDTVNLIITPNPSPTIGTYADVSLAQTGATAVITPSTPPADANNNLIVSPVSVLPATLPGGGTVSVNATNGIVTVTSTPASTLGATPIRVTVLDACGAAAVRIFTASVTAPPVITNGPPPSPVTVGTPYSFAFTSTGFPVPTYAVTAGTLPSGLSLSTAGLLSGTPDAVGTGSYPNITVTATNGVAPPATKTFTLNVVTLSTNYIAGFGLTGANALLTADPDGDGLANLMEYALGLNPTIPGGKPLPRAVIQLYGVPVPFDQLHALERGHRFDLHRPGLRRLANMDRDRVEQRRRGHDGTGLCERDGPSAVVHGGGARRHPGGSNHRTAAIPPLASDDPVGLAEVQTILSTSLPVVFRPSRSRIACAASSSG